MHAVLMHANAQRIMALEVLVCAEPELTAWVSVPRFISQGKHARGSQPRLGCVLFLSVNLPRLELSFVNCIATH